MNKIFILLSIVLIIFPSNSANSDENFVVTDDNPAPEAVYMIGSTYEMDGVMYHPHYDPRYKKIGIASYYGPGFYGRRTANGDIFNDYSITAAHPTLPLGSRVRVTNLSTKKSIYVTINDRGPFIQGRILDLSIAAAIELDIIDQGVAKVKVEYDQAETERYLKQNGLYDDYKRILHIKDIS